MNTKEDQSSVSVSPDSSTNMLAVQKEEERKGLAKLLKLHQRVLLLPMGVRTAFWT
jgi:predicted GNAT superfamily acetyltransferase